MKRQIFTYIFTTFLLLTLCQTSLQAQICNGSLGENIFVAGDFGTGAANILPFDPGIAPGYNYNNNPPPFDGDYVITNNMAGAPWSNLFGTWLRIGDNSSDPNGYMMVVNASFSPGIFYEQVVDDLCENTTYEFSADVINLIRRNVSDHIRPNVSFLLDDDVKFQTGEIPQDEQWKTVGFLFQTAPGQTSIKLTLRNNAPGGIGNDLALDNITFRACGPDAITSTDLDGKICEEDNQDLTLRAEIDGSGTDAVIQWQSRPAGGVWSDIPGATNTSYEVTEQTTGMYQFRYIFAQTPANLQNVKCRTLSSPIDIEVVPKRWSFIDTMCTGSSIPFGDIEITAGGIYYDSLTSSIGCDSFVTLQIIELPNILPVSIESTDPLCPGDSLGSISFSGYSLIRFPYHLEINNQDYEFENTFTNLNSGVYSIRLEDRFGCVHEEIKVLEDPIPISLDGKQNYNAIFGDIIHLAFQLNKFPTSYSWSSTLGFQCDTCLNPQILTWASENYRLSLIDENGCTYYYEFNIDVEDSRPIYIPSAFSPNNDGINDRFQVFSKPGIISNIVHFKIYNRWGGQVFAIDQTDVNLLDIGWDGKGTDGKDLLDGSYLYDITIRFIDGQSIDYQGIINVIR